MQDMDGGVPGGEVIGDPAGAVGGVVIDDQKIHGHREAQEPFRHHGKVLAFVVRGYDDECVIHAPGPGDNERIGAPRQADSRGLGAGSDDIQQRVLATRGTNGK